MSEPTTEYMPASATNSEVLRAKIMDSRIPKTEAEWRAHRTIDGLEGQIAEDRRMLGSMMAARVLLEDAEKRIARMEECIELAWGIIASAGEGNWQRESKDWQDAAAKWRSGIYSELWRDISDRRARQHQQPAKP